MTHAYDQSYLSKTSRAIGNMLHYAVIVYKIDGENFLQRFIQSGIASQIENGNPKYIVGKSGIELFLEVMTKTSTNKYDIVSISTYNRSDVYWVGWMLTHYQWYACGTFKTILNTIPYEELLAQYKTLHEADIQKSYEVLDTILSQKESKLKTARLYCGLTQEELASKSGVSLNTIKAYERKSKNLNKAQIDIIRRLANTLYCDISELLE